MTLEEAINYITLAENEGYPVPDIENMTDGEIIQWAEEQGKRGDVEL